MAIVEDDCFFGKLVTKILMNIKEFQFATNPNISSNLNLRNINRILAYGFFQVNQLNSIIFSPDLEYIGVKAFGQCENLKTVLFNGNNLKMIDDGAFHRCTSLESIKIPINCVSLGNEVFKDCLNLKSISLPSTISEIGTATFERCFNLNNIVLPSNILELKSNIFECCFSLQKIIIPNSVKKIERNAFFRCKNLEEIHLSNSLIELDDTAFNKCKNLKKIYINNSTSKTIIEQIAFLTENTDAKLIFV